MRTDRKRWRGGGAGGLGGALPGGELDAAEEEGGGGTEAESVEGAREEAAGAEEGLLLSSAVHASTMVTSAENTHTSGKYGFIGILLLLAVDVSLGTGVQVVGGDEVVVKGNADVGVGVEVVVRVVAGVVV